MPLPRSAIRSALGLGLLALILPLEVRADPADGLEDPAVAAHAPPVPHKAGETPGLGASGLPVVRRMGPAAGTRFGTIGHGALGGALSGKTVYVSAGHGWTWVDDLGWRTQRPNTHGLVEDFISTETISHYLVHYLQNMGALVVTVREVDYNPALSVIDDGDPDGFAIEGDLEVTEASSGYGHLDAPIADQSNPFTAGSSTVFPAAATATGRAVWTFDVPADGTYDVKVGYVQDPGRASDAHYVVRHAGGETEFRVDQRRHGGTWVSLGRFYFYAGQSSARGAVVLVCDSADDGATLSADVARIGGGVGIIDRGGGANGRPMFENNSRYNAQLSGAPASVYDYSTADGNDDVGTRSRFSAWDHEDGEDAVYISWHTNAPDPARGTSSFAYGPSSYGPLSEFTGVPGSLELMDAVHTELIEDLRADWQSDWQDRGQHTAYFGEVNPNHNPEMPSALFEIAFHDTLADADCLRDPRFRSLAARAMAQGVAKYFATRDGADLTLPPGPPTAPRMTGVGPEQLRVGWSPPADDPAGGDPPTGYRVYLSRDGHGFDNGTDTTETSLDIPAPADMGPIYARITATNAGGESFPTTLVGAKPAPLGYARVLVVAGFERLDGLMLFEEDLSDYDLGVVQRGLIERINDTSHAARHGDAIAAAGYAFDTVAAAAVAAGEVDLGDYDAVSWFVGEESTVSQPLDPDERAAVTDYLAGGGRLFLSGSEIGWALAYSGSAEEQAFFHDVLHTVYVADDADTYLFDGIGGVFDDLGELDFADFGAGSYDAEYPDVFDPAEGSGAEPVLAYPDGVGGNAAIWWQEPGGARLMVMGFPFETIAGAEARAEVMARILSGFDIGPDPEPEPEPPVSGDPTGLSGGCGCRLDPDSRAPVLFLVLVAAALWRPRRARWRPWSR